MVSRRAGSRPSRFRRRYCPARLRARRYAPGHFSDDFMAMVRSPCLPRSPPPHGRAGRRPSWLPPNHIPEVDSLPMLLIYLPLILLLHAQRPSPAFSEGWHAFCIRQKRDSPPLLKERPRCCGMLVRLRASARLGQHLGRGPEADPVGNEAGGELSPSPPGAHSLQNGDASASRRFGSGPPRRSGLTARIPAPRASPPAASGFGT